MSRLALCGATLLDPEARTPAAGSVLIEAGRIIDCVGADAPIGGDWRRIDLTGRVLAPGFVDLHFHGELAHAATDAFAGALARSAARMLQGGTTSFLATTMAWPDTTLEDALPVLQAAVTSPAPGGARCVGLHLEGPWINAESPGAMQADHMHGFVPARDLALLDHAGEALSMVTLAPELEGSSELLAELARRGVLAALGHTRASREVIERAVGEGLRHVTHLFNAMGPVHHRAPGVAGHALANDHLHCDLICDGAHVHPDMVRLAARALGERLVLISDRVDLEPPHGGAARDATPNRLPDGTLLGSRLDLDQAVDNLRRFAGASLLDAVAACTVRPARLIGREAELGTLRRGARADFAVLAEDGALQATWLAGVPVFESARSD